MKPFTRSMPGIIPKRSSMSGRRDRDETEWNHSLLAHDTLVAEEDGRLVGFADLGENGYLDRLYVHSAFQGRGVARRS